MFVVLLILLQGLGVVWPASSPPLGMTVHVVPLESNQGQTVRDRFPWTIDLRTVRAHFTAVVSGDCSDVTGLCADGEDCLVEHNTIPFTGSRPGGSWCSHHWQKTLAANFTGNITLSSASQMFVSLKTEPTIRGNTGKLNHPAFVALPPPLRVNEKCPHHIPLSIQDLDRDRVLCRLARAGQGECVDCEPHDFIELHQEKCELTFTGDAAVGVYYIYLMAEDRVPSPNIVLPTQSRPLSAVPIILSLTVEEAKYPCSAEPVATVDNPNEKNILHILPFQQKSFDVNYESNQESVVEVAVIGPPELYRTGFLSLKPLASLSIAWVRTENKLPRLLPVCFVANTQNLQSEPRCVWIFQREIMSLPSGTVLSCGEKEMSLVLPISSFSNINVTELQLNSPDCPVAHNDTHLTATIPLEGCGTRAVHQNDELIYTNTLQTVRSSARVIRRHPVLVLPLACRIPGVRTSGPQYQIAMPEEKEVFGEVEFKLTFRLPGKGPLAKFTNNPVFRYDNHRVRARREVGTEATMTSPVSGGNSSSSVTVSTNVTAPGSGTNPSKGTTASNQIGSKIDKLDLYVSSNCSISRAEIIVSSCIESATADFVESHALLDGGCTASASALEVVTTTTGTRIYRLDLSGMNSQGSTMYVRCTVNLCITTRPSQTCPDLCTSKFSRAKLVNSVFSSSYTITSDAVSLIYTTAPPKTTVPTAEPVGGTAAQTTARTSAPATATVAMTTTVNDTASRAARVGPAAAVLGLIMGALIWLPLCV